MVNFGPQAAEINPVVWGILANFNGFCVLAALLHGSQVLCVSQTLRRWTEGATYIQQGGHHVGHWPTFLVHILLPPFYHHLPAKPEFVSYPSFSSSYCCGKVSLRINRHRLLRARCPSCHSIDSDNTLEEKVAKCLTRKCTENKRSINQCQLTL